MKEKRLVAVFEKRNLMSSQDNVKMLFFKKEERREGRGKDSPALPPPPTRYLVIKVVLHSYIDVSFQMRL